MPTVFYRPIFSDPFFSIVIFGEWLKFLPVFITADFFVPTNIFADSSWIIFVFPSKTCAKFSFPNLNHHQIPLGSIIYFFQQLKHFISKLLVEWKNRLIEATNSLKTLTNSYTLRLKSNKWVFILRRHQYLKPIII